MDEVALEGSSPAQSSKDILQNVKRKTFYYVLATVTFTIGLNLLVYYSVELSYDFEVEFMWGGLVVCLGLLLISYFTKAFTASYWLFNFFLLIFIPVRYVVPGGAQSALVFGFIAHSVFVFAMSGPKEGLALLVWNCVVLMYLGAPLLGRDYSDGPFAVAVVVLLLFFVAIVSIYFVLEGLKRFLHSIREREKNIVSDILLNQLGEVIEDIVGLARKMVAKTVEDGKRARMENVEEICRTIDSAIKTAANSIDEEEINAQILRLREKYKELEKAE